jgi:2-oxo-4-hydroxy-4-carboxy--5-ureidoimidazoline (OHCU) decarboxylase
MPFVVQVFHGRHRQQLSRGAHVEGMGAALPAAVQVSVEWSAQVRVVRDHPPLAYRHAILHNAMPYSTATITVPIRAPI